MNANGTTREQLLDRYGRFYGEQHFAVAFTSTIEGDDAKRVTTAGWDKTAPLATADYGAGLITTRGIGRNLAIVLRPSNLIVLECDSEEDLIRIGSLNLPETLTVRSSTDYKRHFYFRPPPDIDILPYVAFRFESGKLTADTGRYFLAPPSVHPSGQIYAFLPEHGPGELEIAVLPGELYTFLVEQARKETDALHEAIRVDPGAKIREGNRRTILFRYACMLRRWGLSREEIAAATHAYNEARCDPPVERRLVEVQIDGAMKKDGDQELAQATIEPPGQADRPRDSWDPINLLTLPEKPPVMPTLGGTGLVYPGKRHVFSGPPESGKTLAAYAILISVVRNGATGMLIDFEMGAYDARDRLRELGATSEELQKVSYLEPDQPATPERIAVLVMLQPSLVVVDAAAGAYDIQGLDDNKRGDVERIARLYVNAFWRAGIATIFVDHVVKNTETRGSFVIGSERKLGGADVHLGFTTLLPISRGKTGKYKIVTHKDRGGWLKRGELAELDLSSDPETHSITWAFKRPAEIAGDIHYHRPTHLMEKVSAHLELQHEAVTRNTVAAALGGTKKWVLNAITALVIEGFVTETDGPNRAKLVQSERKYRENDPSCNPENAPGGSVVPGGSTVVREPESVSGSVVRPSYEGETTDHHVQTTTDDEWWFGSEPELEPANDDIPF